MRALLRQLVLSAVLILAHATTSGVAKETSASSSPADVRIEIKNGELTLETRNAPLHEVMREIGELVGFKTVLVGDFVEPPLVSVSLESMPVREAVERLVSDKNRIILYAPSGDGAQQRISQVWLLESGGESVDFEVGDDKGIALGRETDIRGHKLANLTKMLQQDQNVVVRSRAAIALGAFQDVRAVLALESALLDKDPSVRSQAINALGRIGSEQATMVLGNVLLHTSAEQSERVIAAQALWKNDSELAQSYLRAGSNDTDEQVRLASSKPPLFNKVPTTNGHLSSTAAQ